MLKLFSRYTRGEYVGHCHISREILDSFSIEGSPSEILEIYVDNTNLVWNPIGNSVARSDTVTSKLPCKGISAWLRRVAVDDDVPCVQSSAETEDESCGEERLDLQEYETRKIIISVAGEMFPAFFIR
jgi:hypothetical protein